VSDLLAPAMEWLAASGPPNWLVLLGWFTAPAMWSDALRERVRPLLDRVFPGKAEKKEAAE